ncbi:S8 family peptidase [Angustibacter sp. McL0619]|uniref:S8 family peptidase n=1 Tax=Angustibacter sp. McL0619 TaxID=3415676 RepID=UPI003CE8592E
MRRSAVVTLLSVLVVGAATAIAPGAAGATPTATRSAEARAQASGAKQYVVLYKSAGGSAAGRAAIVAAGGSVVSENTEVGYAIVRSDRTSFSTDVSRSTAVEGAAADRVIGYAPKEQRAQSLRRNDIERLTADRAARAKAGKVAAGQADAAAVPVDEPLANRQWDMRQIGATPGGSYGVQPGKPTVRVGIIDTGIDGTHPDIAANFDAADSHNFVTDLPVIDGPCEYPSCIDPVDHDDDGHGTHVASTVASPINGLGTAGVAPGVTLVNLRAGQDSGFFFLAPTLQAISYAGDIGVDVINMSFFTDPWLYNCVSNPADSPAEQSEQRVIRETTQRALNYARRHGVLPVAALGNEFTDLGDPTVDTTSPDYPEGTAKVRTVDNSCITVPTESKGVVSVSSTGPSTRMSYFSNYGTEQNDVAAPGGDAYDSPDETLDPRNLVLAAYPKNVAEANGDLNPDGTPNNDFVVRDCLASTCAYYQYLQGTSMASPHAVGVAALIVSQYGHSDAAHGGLTLAPATTERILKRTAVDHACPQPRAFTWVRHRPDGSVATATATCTGPTSKNGFYGNGIVNAYAAVTGSH